jgi:hypothetical protein
MAQSLYRHPTRSEVIELAAAEGHDADIPTNVGTIHDTTPSNCKHPGEVKPSAMDLEKEVLDVEKGGRHGPTSISSTIDASEHDGHGAEDHDDDPDIVFWDSPTDTVNPMNWSPKKKWGTVLLVSCITFLTPLASSMFAPGVPDVMETFHSTDNMLEGFMVSVYVLGFAFGPLIFAPLSELYGRLPVYHTCNCFFVVFTIAAGLSSHMTMFIVFRFFMGCK